MGLDAARPSEAAARGMLDVRFSTAKVSLMVASAWLLLRRLGACAWLGYMAARSHVRAWLGTGLGSPHTHHGPTAYRVYAFNEDHAATAAGNDGDDDGGTPTPAPAPADPSGFYVEIPVSEFDPAHWDADVARATGWSTFRVEIRYAFRSKKYRMVLRRGDPCTFPPYAEPSAPACRLPKGVLSARLLGPLGSDVECDVTSRVMKYQGPRGDFHAGLGLAVRLHDMFPFDDHEDNNARFAHLRLMDTRGKLHDLVVRDNPVVAPAAHATPTTPTRTTAPPTAQQRRSSQPSQSYQPNQSKAA